MESSSSLSFLLTLPLIGMAIGLVVPKAVQRLYAIFGSLLFLAITLYETAGLVCAKTGMAAASFVAVHPLVWVPEFGIELSLRLDPTSVWFVVLNAMLGLLAFSTRGVWYRKNPQWFTAFGFFLMFALNAAFLSQDLVSFYLAYEAVFIPMIFMTGIWGENQKASSVFRFFLMSFLGSILMLVSIFYLIQLHHAEAGVYSSRVQDLIHTAGALTGERRLLTFLGFFLAFAVKVPLVPFHGWLKEVYVNAPMPATLWMSAILSKLGIYGMLRFVMPLFPMEMANAQGLLVAAAAVSVVYAALLAYRSRNPKALLAYSSISHLGFVLLGLFTLKEQGISAAIFLSIGHALSSGVMFYLLSQIEEREQEISLDTPHGLSGTYPILFGALFVGMLASVSLPGTLNFTAEFLVLNSSYSTSIPATAIALLGSVLGAAYMLKFYQMLGFGLSSRPGDAPTAAVKVRDLGGWDLVLVLVFLLVLVVAGFKTGIFLKGN